MEISSGPWLKDGHMLQFSEKCVLHFSFKYHIIIHSSLDVFFIIVLPMAVI